MRTAILTATSLVLSISVLTRAAIRTVPDQYRSVQAAIDYCNDGDTVIVSPGTHTGDGNWDIDCKGKAIIVRSSDLGDPDIVAATIIDCNASEADQHRGFIFDSNEGPDSVFDSLTITNGYAPEVKSQKLLVLVRRGPILAARPARAIQVWPLLRSEDRRGQIVLNHRANSLYMERNSCLVLTRPLTLASDRRDLLSCLLLVPSRPSHVYHL